MKKKDSEITEYDQEESLLKINKKRRVHFEEIGLKLPETPPSQVISIRLPTKLLNELRAYSSERDIPYQSLIKTILAEAIAKKKAS